MLSNRTMLKWNDLSSFLVLSRGNQEANRKLISYSEVSDTDAQQGCVQKVPNKSELEVGTLPNTEKRFLLEAIEQK